MTKKVNKILIGIDVGVNTGVALYDCENKKLVFVSTMKIHQAMANVILQYTQSKDILVRFEDARLRKWFGNAGREQLQGAGSIKRDSLIWEDFLTDFNIPFEAVAPKNNLTKMTAEYFKKLTGYTKRTSEHSRDAAMLVFGK